jgi:hypothetical protein
VEQSINPLVCFEDDVIMPRLREKRTFIEGWISETDPQLMALIWRLEEPTGPQHEAEVIWGDQKIDTITAAALVTVKRMLERRYEGSAKRRMAG